MKCRKCAQAQDWKDMIKDITIGQYYQAESIIHRLDPRVKLMGTLVFIISLFLGMNIWIYTFVTVALAAVIAISKIPLKFMVRGLKSIVILIIISAVFNLFLTPGETLIQIWKLTITYEGLKTAIFMVVRLVYLILGTSLMTLTTTPNNLTDGLEKGLGFLKYIKVPVHEIAMMMSIALRFIQMARGADFENGNIIKRAKAMVPILVPLFVSAFRRANELAMAMEARCYHGSEGRTKMKPLKYAKRDKIAYLCMFAYLGVLILIKIFV